MNTNPWAMAVLFALLLVSVPSRATLGQDEASADTDGKRLHARRAVRAQEGYRVHEIQLPSGTMVHEYVSPSGKVFAVTWQGPTLPDLEQLMGDKHYRNFIGAPDARRVPRRMRSLQRDDLVVHSSGHQRAFSGYAYVPALVPPGVIVESLP